jgi:signal transduction histidine kinase/DNA-binding NarL/FixJ family response regulator
VRLACDASDWLRRAGPYASIILGLSTVLLIWGGALYFSYSEKVHTEQSALQNAGNLSGALAEQMIRSVRAADQTLLYVRDSYAKDPQNFDMSLWTHNSQFLGGFNFQVALIGKDGRMIASNIPGSAPGVDLSDREHFKVHAEREADELFISKPIIGRVSNKLSINLTRRITMPDGSFGGVAVVSVDPHYLSQFYETIDVGDRGAVTLIGTDGIIRARRANGPSAVGQSLSTGPVFKAMTRSNFGFFTNNSLTDGVERLFAYRKVDGYPLVITVGLATEDVLKVYEQNRRKYLAIAAFASLWLLGVIYLMVRHERLLAEARGAAEAGTRARSEFLAMMSHEIRTPMNGVIGMAELLLAGNLAEEQRGFAKSMRDSAGHLLQIINDVLDFSKLEAGRLEIEKIRFAVGDLVRDTVRLMAVPAQQKGLMLSMRIAPEVPHEVIGDPARLRQVLLNLVGNGLKFTEAGHVAVEVGLGRDASPGRVRLVFAVADTGIGIPADAVPLLFREFSQLDSSIARRFGGTGLGLAICKRLIDLMGGTISVESKFGKGTTFKLMLDYLPASAAGPERVPACDPLLAPPLAPAALAERNSIRILLAEDNKTNQLVAIKLIQGFGYTVDVVDTGAAAVAACGATKYDLVLMDVMMPEMDGIAATKAIRKLPPPFSTPCIIALTANVQQDDRDACRRAGMDDFLGKPVTRRGIAAVLRQFHAAAPQNGAPASDGGQTTSVDGTVDEAIYTELADALGADDVRVVIEQFLSDTAQRLQAMREGMSAGDFARVAREAHTAKGSSGSLGFLRFSNLAESLELDIAGLDRPTLEARLDGLKAEFARIKAILRFRRIAFSEAGR